MSQYGDSYSQDLEARKEADTKAAAAHTASLRCSRCTTCWGRGRVACGQLDDGTYRTMPCACMTKPRQPPMSRHAFGAMSDRKPRKRKPMIDLSSLSSAMLEN